MIFHLLKNNSKIRQKPLISTIPFKNWLLPSWFIKQSNPLSPGYIIDCHRFANLCHRNWTAFFNDKGEETITVDEEGTISFPKIGVSVEIWVKSEKTLFRPGSYKTRQKASSDFPCIRTKSVFENGSYENRIFQIDGTKNGTAGMEIEFHACGEHVFSEILLFFVIRPFDHNGLAVINRLEYSNRRLKVNNKELIQCETEPDIVFCTKAEAGDVTEYFKLEQNNEMIASPAGDCTGAIGYMIRPADGRIIRLGFKTGQSKLFSYQDLIFSKGWLFESEQKWVNRYHFQHRMIKTGSRVDYLYHTNMNFFNMFSGDFNEWIDVYGIFVLNRFALYNKSRAFLISAIKKIRWDGSMPSSKRLSPEALVFALIDYYRFSGDQKLIKDNWQLIKRIGFWLIQNKKPVFNGSTPENHHSDLGWTCAAFKGLSELSELSGCFEDYRFFREHFQQLWAYLLSFFSHRIKEDHQGFQKGLSISNTLDWLCLSYPLGLYPRNERFIKEWLIRITETSLNNGGVFSPFEFQGVDPGLTARLGSILLREGLRYEPLFMFLIEAASPTGCWPDRIHPVLKSGIGITGHAPDVCCHFLLLFRNMMVMEEEGVLYLLPGILNSYIWDDPNIELRSLPTVFGEITLKCRSVGKIVQIDFSAVFHNKPRLIRLLLNAGDRLVYSDAFIGKTGKWVELGSEFKIARLRRDLNQACLDNTFIRQL